MRAGEVAEKMFFIRSGTCEVLVPVVEQPPSESNGNASSTVTSVVTGRQKLVRR